MRTPGKRTAAGRSESRRRAAGAARAEALTPGGGHARVPALHHGLLVLERLAAGGPAKVPELVAELRVPRSSMYNILTTLADHGMVVLDHGTVRLGVRLLHLAAAVLASLDLRRIARPVMQELVARTEETVNVGVLSGSEVVYIDIVPTPLPIKLSSEVGRTCPAYCTALGKALLAWAPSEEFDRLVQRMHWTRYTPRTAVGREALVRACAQVRERGWAVDDEEFEEGVRCLAVPLRDHTGAVRAALSLSGPEFRMPERRWPALLAALRDAQATIEAALGWSGAASQAVGAAASQVVGAAVSASDAAPSGASPAAPTASPAAAGRPGPAPGRRGSRAARR